MFKNFLYRRNIFTLMPDLTAGWVKQVCLFVCEYKKDAATTFVEQAGTTF